MLNEDKSLLKSRHYELAVSLVNDIVDVESFGLVVNYLGKHHPTTYKYDAQPFTLQKCLAKGMQYLQEKNPGFEAGLEMLKVLPRQSSEVLSPAIQGYMLVGSDVQKIYEYTISNVRTANQAKALISHFNQLLSSSIHLGNQLVLTGPVSVFYDIIQRSKAVLVDDASPIKINAVAPYETPLRILIAEINFSKASTPQQFIGSIPRIVDPVTMPHGDRSEEYLKAFEPALVKDFDRFMSMNPTPGEILELFDQAGSTSGYPKPEKWSESKFRRSLDRKLLAPYLSDEQKVTAMMISLKSTPLATGNGSFDRLEVLYMLQTAIPTRLQAVFLSSLAEALPPDLALSDVDKILVPYQRDREFEDQAIKIRSGYKSTRR